MQSFAPNTTGCWCFSTCTADEAADFLNAIPDVVSSKSPWLGYLRAVYAEDVQLPFNLSRLNFFYHNDAVWRRSHPGVVWPMRPCVLRNNEASQSAGQHC